MLVNSKYSGTENNNKTTSTNHFVTLYYLTCGVLERLVALHVAVDPHPLVLPLPLHHVRVRHVVLVVPPDDVIYRSLVQHGHHPDALDTPSLQCNDLLMKYF